MVRYRIYFSLLMVVACTPRLKIHKELAIAENQFQDHIGLMVYDPEKRKSLIEFNASKYFTPASNTKILTLLSGIQIIGDSIPALRYIEKGDSLIFWGTGDPSFLYSEVYQNDRVFNFLANHSDSLYFSLSNFYQEHFGPGWAWDDYNYGYSPERSPFPIYGNLFVVTDSVDNTLRASPSYFQSTISISETISKEKKVKRGIANNNVDFSQGLSSDAFTQTIPFHVTPELTVNLLTDTLHRKVKLVDTILPLSAKVFYSIPADSLYKVMMQQSDNFIAEQLLQLCAGILSDSFKSDIAIESVKKKFLFDLPDEPRWVDGSGLSRYNLFTPRSIVRLWDKMLTLVPRDRLFQLLAVGGKAGTIKDAYKAEVPYIFGKTGTLSNNYCLSGYLVTKKGRVLIFSFMNNNYTVPTREIRGEMERILSEIHERY